MLLHSVCSSTLTSSGSEKELPILVEESENGKKVDMTETHHIKIESKDHDELSTTTEEVEEREDTDTESKTNKVKSGERKRQYPYSEVLNEATSIDTNGINTIKLKTKSKKRDVDDANYNLGRWSAKEKRLFLEGLHQFGKGRWKKIGQLVTTR